MADGILTPCNVARSWHWFRQVTAPCNVACGSGIVTMNSPSGSTMWYVALGWHAIEFAQMSAILEFYIWFRFRPHHRSPHVILHQSPKFYPNRTTLGRKNDMMSIFKIADLILDYRKKPNYKLLNCLVFRKIAFLYFGVKIQDGGFSPYCIIGVPSWVLSEAHVRLPISRQ